MFGNLRWRIGIVVIAGLVGCDAENSREETSEASRGERSAHENSKVRSFQDEGNGERRRVIKRDKAEHPLVTKMESIILPVVDCTNVTVNEFTEFLRMRSVELDPDQVEGEEGVSFVVRHLVNREPTELMKQRGVITYHGVEVDGLAVPSYYRENISLMNALTEFSTLGKVDTYLTTKGVVVVAEGKDPVPHFKEGADLIKVIRKSDTR